MNLPALPNTATTPVNITNSIATAPATSTTRTTTARSSETYVFGVGILAVFAIGVCVFFPDKKKSSLVANKVKGKQTPKRRFML